MIGMSSLKPGALFLKDRELLDAKNIDTFKRTRQGWVLHVLGIMGKKGATGEELVEKMEELGIDVQISSAKGHLKKLAELGVAVKNGLIYKHISYVRGRND